MVSPSLFVLLNSWLSEVPMVMRLKSKTTTKINSESCSGMGPKTSVRGMCFLSLSVVNIQTKTILSTSFLCDSMPCYDQVEEC